MASMPYGTTLASPPAASAFWSTYRSGAHSSHADVTYRRDARALESLRRYLPARRALEPREGLNSRRALVGGSTRDHAPSPQRSALGSNTTAVRAIVESPNRRAVTLAVVTPQLVHGGTADVGQLPSPGTNRKTLLGGRDWEGAARRSSPAALEGTLLGGRARGFWESSARV